MESRGHMGSMKKCSGSEQGFSCNVFLGQRSTRVSSQRSVTSLYRLQRQMHHRRALSRQTLEVTPGASGAACKCRRMQCNRHSFAISPNLTVSLNVLVHSHSAYWTRARTCSKRLQDARRAARSAYDISSRGIATITLTASNLPSGTG